MEDRSANADPDPIELPSERNPLPGQGYYDPSVRTLIGDERGENEAYFEGALNYGMETPGLLRGNGDPMVAALNEQYYGDRDDERMARSTENKYASGKLADSSRMGSAQKDNEVFRNEVGNYEQQMAYRFKRQAIYNQWQAAREAGKMDIFKTLFSGLTSAAGAAIGAR
jgi:hypothetical protein